MSRGVLKPLRVGALAVAAVMMATLGGCVSVDAVSRMEASGPLLNVHLHKAYLDLAQARQASGEGFAASLFAAKARAAARGEPVPPERLDDWPAPPGRLDDLVVARARLITALAETRGTHAPQLAAEAQASFDCWIEGAGKDSATSGGCPDRFAGAIDRLEAELRNVHAPARE